MSLHLYRRRLYWDRWRGSAKLGDAVSALVRAPCIGGAPVDAVDYAPEIQVRMIMWPGQGWRDMTPAECEACDVLLRELTDAAHR